VTGRGASRTGEGEGLTVYRAHDADVDANPSTAGAQGSSRWRIEPLCSEQCSSASQIPRAPTIFFKSATIAFKFSCYKIDFWFLGRRKQGLKHIKRGEGGWRRRSHILPASRGWVCVVYEEVVGEEFDLLILQVEPLK
jgi:hypothetical protein